MPYIKFDTPTDANKTSPNGFLNYMKKQDLDSGIDKEFWFNELEDYIPDYRIIEDIESQKGLGKNDFRYYTGSISFSQEELSFIDNDIMKLKEFGKQFIENVYPQNFNKRLLASDIRFYLKLESDRFYKGSDREVVSGKVKSGDKKPGNNLHFHFVTGRKSTDDKHKLSPLTAHINTTSGAVIGGFSRDNLKEQTEILFDTMFHYNRPLEQTYRHMNNMSPGKDITKRMYSIKQDTDKEQSQLKYNYLSSVEKQKKLTALMNYMQHGQRDSSEGAVLIDNNQILNEAQKRNFNGDVYKALLNMNYRLKNDFQPNQDLTPFIIEYARFVSAPYGKLPDSLKKDRFMRFGKIINNKLPDDKKLDLEKLFRVEQQNQLNGKIYRALGEFNKYLATKESKGDANETVIALSKEKQVKNINTQKENQETQSSPIIKTLSSLLNETIMGDINNGNSSSAYKEELKPKKKKKKYKGPKF
ncbi:DUF5712 family protein [Carboxylicivirga marina]|uniref:Mobilization protein n=1 Tax=Carboxylicivirga marina TaxID=2800988 RepID=A0ABS1HM40_9BACT|nr:DUF5712 family protein [Carboxylicivirga marina]MBK3518723.1 hypothetical protein [Carboxylicivirga marina]